VEHKHGTHDRGGDPFVAVVLVETNDSLGSLDPLKQVVVKLPSGVYSGTSLLVR